MRLLATILAGLLGLAFGSFLNVCLSRWPAGESVVKPRSHCRSCGRALVWWENIPVLSWLALRGKCRTCGARISARYVLVELAVGVMWAVATWRFIPVAMDRDLPAMELYRSSVDWIGTLLLALLLIGLAVLDAEHLWLPDIITVPAIIVGCVFTLLEGYFSFHSPFNDIGRGKPLNVLLELAMSIVLCAGFVIIIRWLYWLIRRREGIGLGDVKLMAMLAAWLGLPGALLAFFLGVVTGALAAVAILLIPRLKTESWSTQKLPLGTFLCIGGIVSSLWGEVIITSYLHWAGF